MQAKPLLLPLHFMLGILLGRYFDMAVDAPLYVYTTCRRNTPQLINALLLKILFTFCVGGRMTGKKALMN